MSPFLITNKLSLTDFLKGAYLHTYSKVWIKTLSLLTVIFIAYTAIQVANNNEAYFDSFLFLAGFIITLCAFMTPLMLLFIFIKAYKTDKRAKETVTYEISTEEINVTGETFKANFHWDTIYKAEIVGNWLYFYQNGLVGNTVSLHNSSPSDINQLKNFIKNKK